MHIVQFCVIRKARHVIIMIKVLCFMNIIRTSFYIPTPVKKRNIIHEHIALMQCY